MSIPYPDSLSFSAIRRKEKDRHYVFSLLDIYIYFIILTTVLYSYYITFHSLVAIFNFIM